MIRTAIISDIHGNLEALLAVMEDIASVGVERIVCLGDVVGYGPHPRECLDRIMDLEFCVLGNHDNSALFDPEGFNRTAESAIFWTRQRLETDDGDGSIAKQRLKFICGLPRMVVEQDATFVHGSPRGPTNEYVFPEDVQNGRKLEKLFALVPRMCFQGHTHVPGIFTSDGRFLRPIECEGGWSFQSTAELIGGDLKIMVNVGSVGQPRDGDSRSCYVITDGDRIEFRRVEYDLENTVKAIEAEPDLDNALGYRLREGR